MRSLRVIDGGLFTSVQDLGRPGHRAIGVPPSGAADMLSLIVGNRLLGNTDNAAAIESTLIGPSVALECDAWVCLAGALCPNACVMGTAGERPLPWCEPTRVRTGEVITVGATGDGARAYLCVDGGLGVPCVLASRSTLVGAALGGHEGRALRADDVLPLIDATYDPRSVPSGLHDWLRPCLFRRTIRVVESLHADRFPGDAVERLASAPFLVAEQSDRTGIRLSGPDIPLPVNAGLFESEPTVTGGIQISGDGRAIILGADRPTTGGYPLLACVIESDLPAVAMLSPRDSIRFEFVSIEDARRIACEQRRALDRLLPRCGLGANA